MTLEARTRALLDLVEADRARRCGTVLAEARDRAAQALAQAHAEARARMCRAFEEERTRATQRLAGAQARLQTHRRLAEQRRASALLEAAGQRLPGALRARWEAASTRAQWVDAVLAAARAALPRGAWRLRHAAGWPRVEREAVAAALAGELGAAPELSEEPGLEAGLAIAFLGISVDGTLRGLLADRAEIGARLLRLLDGDTLTHAGGAT